MLPFSLSSFYYPDRQQQLSAERHVVSPAGVMMRPKLCFGQLKGKAMNEESATEGPVLHPVRLFFPPVFTILFISFFFLPRLWICCHHVRTISLIPLSENEFFPPHLIDSICGVQLYQKASLSGLLSHRLLLPHY